MIQEKIKIDLQNISFEIFRDFIKSVAEKHPDIVININNELEIIEDVCSSINKAKIALTKKYKTPEELEKYQVGFMLGFIRSNLNTKWIYEYVIKQSNEYKEFVAVKALQIYLKDNVIGQIRINELYKHLFTTGNNLSEINSGISDFNIGSKELDELTEQVEDNQVLQVLENLVNKYIVNYLNKNEEVFVWPMVKYFSTKGIIELIRFNLK